jgi:hypothetical protein
VSSRHNIFDPDIRQMVKFIEAEVREHGFATVTARCKGKVREQTIRNWLAYRVLSPQSAKLFTVVRACGGKITVE